MERYGLPVNRDRPGRVFAPSPLRGLLVGLVWLPGVALRSTPGYHRSPLRGYRVVGMSSPRGGGWAPPVAPAVRSCSCNGRSRPPAPTPAPPPRMGRRLV